MHDELVISFKRWVLHKMSAPTGSLYKNVNDDTQTVIRVSPHILDTQLGIPKADKKLQTVISLQPRGTKSNFYSLLKYTPYQDISEKSLRIIDLPRKTKLQFNKPSLTNFAKSIRPLCLADDDGVADFCVDMIYRIDSEGMHSNGPRYKEADTQTELMVKPHVLDEEETALIFTNSWNQKSESNKSKPESSTTQLQQPPAQSQPPKPPPKAPPKPQPQPPVDKP